jgi:hypothetical protein
VHHQPFIIMAVAFSTVGLMGCPSKPDVDPASTSAPASASAPLAVLAATVHAQAPDAGAVSCPASLGWLTSSALPSEVSGETMCSFEQFMWQSLLALVQPTSDPTKLQFETWMPWYGIFIKDGTPTPWGQEPPTSCPGDAKGAAPKGAAPKASPDAGAGKVPRLYTNIILQAGSDQPLIDLNNEFVYYGLSVDKVSYDMITSCDLYQLNCAGPLKPGNKGIDLIQKYPKLAFPNSAVELKTSWMVLDPKAAASGLYYVVPGLVQRNGGACRAVTLGLTGMHIVSKTPGFPAFLWGTFEHRNNAPDCDKTSAPPPLGGAWNFYNPACQGCVTNTYKAGTPAQVCRMHPDGNSAVGPFPGGADCTVNPNQFACQASTLKTLAESTQAIRAINQSAQGLIQANPNLINKVWANYELVGNVWTKGKTLPPYLQAQDGAFSDANVTMETFVQNGVAGATNPYSCLSCHDMMGPTNAQNLPPAGLSHLFDHTQMAGGCTNGSLPPACNPYTTSQ